MEAKDFSAVTPEIEALAAKSRENNRIDISLYDKYEVKRGLRDLNGKGVLTGLTEISEVKASEVDENGVSHPCDGKLYYRGHDVEKLIEGFTKDKRFGFEEVTYLLLFGELPEDTDLRKVFLIAIRECLTNGVRHADATLIHAEIVRKNKSILLYITNNGKPPEGVVVPKGGLLNLLRYVADCGGKMKIESLPQYVLSIELPSKNGEIEKE